MTNKVAFWQEILAFLLSTPSTQYIHDTNTNELTSLNDENNDISEGFWGPIDSGIDWCEPNYTVTKYVAEFGNTLSSIPLILWAIIGWYLCWKSGVKEKRYMILLGSLGVIGVGSVAFHGTLRYSAQLLDEIPMMLASYCSLYCALEFENVKPRKLTLYAIIGSVLLQCISYAVLKMYFIFVVGFTIVMLIQGPIIGSKLIHVSSDMPRQAKYLLIFVTVLAFMSFGLWSLENMYCAMLGKFHFHALWHICGGYSLYLLDLLLIYLRGISLKKQSSFEFSKQFKQHFVIWVNE